MSDQVYEFSYFALWAKGPACAIALTMSGLPWKGNDQGTKADLSGTHLFSLRFHPIVKFHPYKFFHPLTFHLRIQGMVWKS